MTEESDRNISHHSAVERVRDAETFAVTLPVLGRVRIPSPDQLAYYGALAGSRRWRSSTGRSPWPSERAMRWPPASTTRSRRNSAKRFKTPERHCPRSG